MEVNRDEAERCRDMGATALRQGNLSRAVKLLQKSLQLFPLPGVEALLEQAKRQQRDATNATNNHNNNENADSSSNNNNNNTTSTTSAPPPPQRSTSTASSTTGADGRTYTEEQVAVVKKVLRAKQGGRGAHYRVLGLEQSCTETEIKKAYRKLSLKVHPDKNAAPHADEAFKAVGLAYATLIDAQKRTIYDRYGDEDPDNNGGGGGMRPGRRGGGGGVHMNGQHVDPDEIFNAFFHGGMPGGMPGGGVVHIYSTGFGPGMHFRAGGPRRAAGPRPQQQQQQQQENAGWNLLLKLLLILLLMYLYFSIMDMPGVNRYFSFTYNPPFTNPLATTVSKVKGIPYFVSDRFMRNYDRDPHLLGQVEHMVYREYLFEECNKQANDKQSLEKQAKREKDPAKQEAQLRQAAAFDLSRCSELDDLFPERRKQKKWAFYAYALFSSLILSLLVEKFRPAVF